MEKLVTIRAYPYYTNAYLALIKLQSEGIYCALQNEHTITIHPFLGNALGGIKLSVPQRDASLAITILDTYAL